MVSDLMKGEQVKLIHKIEETAYVQPDAIAALALIGILEKLEQIELSIDGL